MFLTVEAHQPIVGCVSIQHSLISLPKLFNTGVLIIPSGMKVAIDLDILAEVRNVAWELILSQR